MTDFPAITLLTLTPLAGGVILSGLPGLPAGRARALALFLTGLALAQCLVVGWCFEPGGGLQMIERRSWIPSLGVEYFVGVDGLGVLMVVLTGLLVPFSIGVAGVVRDRASLFYALVLFLQAGLFGAFTALNFFHWFIFWELSLVPAFFLIKFWGGPERSGAATQFFVYTVAGSALLLLAFLALNLATGTFDFLRLAELARSGELERRIGERIAWMGWGGRTWMLVLFFGVLAGFAVKIPLMPFHTWLPAAYAEAPSAVTMILTGALSKMGVYGLIRILLPIFPEPLRMMQVPLVVLAVATVVLGAAAALAQRDLKRMLAYSSINHLGYCLLAVFAVAGPGSVEDREAALNGALLQMFNHGVTAASLFGLVAWLESRSHGLRGLHQFGGLRQAAPVFTGLMGLALFSSLGLPGLNGFVGEFLIFKGVFGLIPWAAAISTLGLLLTALFILNILQDVFSGPLNERWKAFPDLEGGERAWIAPAVALMMVLGVMPQLLMRMVNPTVMELVANQVAK